MPFAPISVPATRSLALLLTPRSVVILGASGKPRTLGNQVLANPERHGFAGDIHLIDRKHDEIAGRKCLTSIDDLPMDVDAAVLATVRTLAGRGIGGVVIFSAGFAEGGENGIAAQREIAAIAKAHGIVVEGPNCLGMTNYVAGIPLTFVEMPPIRLGGGPGSASSRDRAR